MSNYVHVIFLPSTGIPALAFAFRATRKCVRNTRGGSGRAINRRAKRSRDITAELKVRSAPLEMDQSSVEVEIGPESATAFSARCKSGGRTLPRLPARRRIPRQARALK